MKQLQLFPEATMSPS